MRRICIKKLIRYVICNELESPRARDIFMPHVSHGCRPAASCTAAWKSTAVNHSCQARTEDTRMDLREVILLTSA